MSENDERKSEVNERELKQVVGGDAVPKYPYAYYRCETCGRSWQKLIYDDTPAPNCCGKPMKYSHSSVI